MFNTCLIITYTVEYIMGAFGVQNWNGNGNENGNKGNDNENEGIKM